MDDVRSKERVALLREQAQAAILDASLPPISQWADARIKSGETIIAVIDHSAKLERIAYLAEKRTCSDAKCPKCGELQKALRGAGL